MTTGEIISRTADLLWMGGLAASPLAILVGAICRWRSLRPATRHMLWFAVLASFVTPVIGALIWTPRWFRSDHVIAAADSVLTPAKERAEPKAAPMKVIEKPKTVPSVRTLPASPAPSVTAADRPPVAQPGRATAWPAVDTIPSSSGPWMTKVEVEPKLAVVTAEVPEVVQRDRELEAMVTSNLAPRPKPSAPSPAAVGSLGAGRAPVAEGSAENTGGKPVPLESGWGDVRAWLVRLLGVRDAIAALPRVPGIVWFGGALLLITISLCRTLMARHWIHRATPAGPEVQLAVRQVGEALGLSRVPRAYFVDAAISPMIWCGLRTRLVLPMRLWATLDRDARRSVLVHELAHVRRGDHVLCWVQAAIGAVYWWHPVVWWARRRLHDEAEASCDAWVTSLFPSDRRAYASALLVTKSYVSLNERNGGLWLGVVSSSAKRLARRITMVMTEKTAPGMSMVGACVATLVLTAGTFVMPGLACPPEKEAKSNQVVKTSRGTTASSLGASSGAATASEPGVPFLGEAPALEAMRVRNSSDPLAASATQPAKVADAPRAPKAPKAPKAAKAPRPATAPMAPVAPLAPFVSTGRTNAVAGVPAAGMVTSPADFEALKVGRTPRDYPLTGGKLSCFYSFMSRNDVPILVENGGDHITIWGTDSEHEVFGKFIKIVGSGGEAEVTAGHDPLNVAGVEMNRGAEARRYEAAAKLAEAARAGHADRAAKVSRDALSQYRVALDELARNRDAFESDTERAREQAEAARERAETMRELAQELRERANGLGGGDERKELEAVAKRLHSKSDALESEAKSMEDRVARLEKQLEEIERRADALEEKIDEIDSESEEGIEDEAIEVEGVEMTEVGAGEPGQAPIEDHVEGMAPVAEPTDEVAEPAEAAEPVEAVKEVPVPRSL